MRVESFALILPSLASTETVSDIFRFFPTVKNRPYFYNLGIYTIEDRKRKATGQKSMITETNFMSSGKQLERIDISKN